MSSTANTILTKVQPTPNQKSKLNGVNYSSSALTPSSSVSIQSYVDSSGFRHSSDTLTKKVRRRRPIRSPIFCPTTPMKPLVQSRLNDYNINQTPNLNQTSSTTRPSFTSPLSNSKPSNQSSHLNSNTDINMLNQLSSTLNSSSKNLSQTKYSKRRKCSFFDSSDEHLDCSCCEDGCRATSSGSRCSSVSTDMVLMLSQPRTINIFETEFDLIGLVGQGSFGRVFKVRQKSDGKLYAVKVSSKQFRNHFERTKALKEVVNYSHLASKNPHPNCVRYFRAQEHDDHLYIQTEYCDRGTLKSYLNFIDSELDEGHIQNFVIDIALGVKHIHDHNLIHLDIKPDNIFLTSTGHLKLGDYGISIHESDFQSGMEGTAAYTAPEIMEPDLGRVSAASDVFSLGLIIFEMACDIEMPTFGMAWANIRNEKDIKIPDHRSQGLSNLINCMLKRNPKDRPTINEVLAVSQTFSSSFSSANNENMLINEMVDEEFVEAKESGSNGDVSPSQKISEAQSPLSAILFSADKRRNSLNRRRSIRTPLVLPPATKATPLSQFQTPSSMSSTSTTKNRYGNYQRIYNHGSNGHHHNIDSSESNGIAKIDKNLNGDFNLLKSPFNKLNSSEHFNSSSKNGNCHNNENNLINPRNLFSDFDD